jgi:hypothetical protein
MCYQLHERKGHPGLLPPDRPDAVGKGGGGNCITVWAVVSEVYNVVHYKMIWAIAQWVSGLL